MNFPMLEKLGVEILPGAAREPGEVTYFVLAHEAEERLAKLLKRREIIEHEFICSTCAKERKGWTWPEGHAATIHLGECPYCLEKDSYLSSWRDWLRPGQDEITLFDWD